ncbi:MAG TPA: N-methyl-L-tryptophan oxidase [Methylomirabilota bacterium]|nr:N-methyl-L-tryptophan oxidase [Methylomirabilota bacterium]
MSPQAVSMDSAKTYDVAVVGAGVFGAWTAWHLARAGRRVVLLDQYGPANARASSGGESRIIRAGYGPDELYTRFALRSLALWKEFFARTGQALFVHTGVLWLARDADNYARQTTETLARAGAPCEKLDQTGLAKRFPQFDLQGVDWGFLEPDAGVLLARRAVEAVLADAVRGGAAYQVAGVRTPAARGKLASVETCGGERISAGTFVFACGPWLGKVFPGVLGERIFPSRQEVFFFGAPPGERRFAPPAMPAWIYLGDEVYGLPDLEGRGFKIAFDRHGEAVDPDTQSRIVSAEMAKRVTAYVARRFPALREAPIVETRVCQYENTSSGDFLVDRHPEMENVWLVGGGSGHGFKHGPAVGEYVAARLAGSAPEEPRFSLASKKTVQKRAVY